MKTKVLWQAATLVEGECARCGGLLIDEIMRDRLDATMSRIDGVRCVMCGWRTDRTGGWGMAPRLPDKTPGRPGGKAGVPHRRKFTAEGAPDVEEDW